MGLLVISVKVKRDGDNLYLMEFYFVEFDKLDKNVFCLCIFNSYVYKWDGYEGFCVFMFFKFNCGVILIDFFYECVNEYSDFVKGVE